MQKRKLGHTDILVSPITIGAWQLGGPLAFDGQPDGHPDPGKENVLRMIRELGERGVNAIDTAEQYSNGESERRVGEAIRGQRDAWIISTKFGYRVGPNNTREDDSSPPTILPSLEGSLKRLGTDRIDIYLYHCAPRVEDLADAHTVLDGARQAGKIRSYGISTNNVPLLENMLKHDLVGVLQYHGNLLEDQPAIHALAERSGFGTQVRGVMARGRLSGKYFHRPAHWRPDDNRSKGADDDYSRYAVFEEAIPEGMTMAQVAIRWTLDNPVNHTICLGAKSLDDYLPALAACEMPPLPPSTREQLQSRVAKLRE